MIETNRGPMTAEEITDYLSYCNYRYNRSHYGMSEERLAKVFGSERCREWEAYYQREQGK